MLSPPEKNMNESLWLYCSLQAAVFVSRKFPHWLCSNPAGFKCKSANTTKTVLDEVKFTLLEKKKKFIWFDFVNSVEFRVGVCKTSQENRISLKNVFSEEILKRGLCDCMATIDTVYSHSLVSSLTHTLWMSVWMSHYTGEISTWSPWMNLKVDIKAQHLFHSI